jgi:hypothetical protein
MNSSSNGFGFRAALSAVFAAAIVGTSGLALDQGHIAAAPAGTVEVGPLTPVDVLPQAAALPGDIDRPPRRALPDRPGRI